MASATSLQAKILSINTINKHSKIIFEHETKECEKFIGTNPLKIDGTFKAKITHNKKEFKRTKISAFGFDWWIETMYYLTNQYGYFSANIRTCTTGGGADINGVNQYCIYEDRSFDLFKIDDNGNFCESDRATNDFKQYKESDLLKMERQIKAEAEKYKAALNKLPYEFRNVLGIERLTR